MKRIFAVFLVFITVFGLTSCNSDSDGKDILNPYFTGKVSDIYDKSCLVEVTDIGNGNFAVGDEVVVTTDISSCPEFVVGDYLTISFDGKVAESYPPQILKVYLISKADGIENTEKEDVSKEADSTESTHQDSSTNSIQGDTSKTESTDKPTETQDDNSSNTKEENNSKNNDKVTASAFTKQQYESIKYWLYTPENPTDNMPLIVYLHGGSGKGDDLELITAQDGFPQYLRDGKLSPRAYVIVPQVSSAYRGWSENKADVMKLISFVTEEYKIDENRISLTGHSMGGTGAWMLAMAYPNTFSAVAPLSGSVKLTDTNIDKLKNLPVWAIVGTEDTIVDPQSSIDFIAELAKDNKTAKLTQLAGADHFAVPNMSYLSKEFDLIEWLLAQTK